MHRKIIVAEAHSALILAICLEKIFFEIFFCYIWIKHFDPPTLPTNQKQR